MKIEEKTMTAIPVHTTEDIRLSMQEAHIKSVRKVQKGLAPSQAGQNVEISGINDHS